MKIIIISRGTDQALTSQKVKISTKFKNIIHNERKVTKFERCSFFSSFILFYFFSTIGFPSANFICHTSKHREMILLKQKAFL